MLVVISDLHFEEEAKDTITDPAAPNNTLTFERNLPATAFEQVIADLAGEASRNKAKRLDFVLAGDIFDLHRTQLWFDPGAAAGPPVRPYESCSKVTPGSALELKVIDILTAIAKESRVKESLAVFHRLAKNKYLEKPGDSTSERDFPVVVTLHYFPGNHDRLVNATANTRQKARELLGLAPTADPFTHTFIPSHNDPRVLVRHGHEYDRYNFFTDYNNQTIPAKLPDSDYDSPTFGDFITVDVACRLPYRFRQIHGDLKILQDADLSRIYLKLLEFDDLRPQSALLDFLLDIPDSTLSQEKIWNIILPVAQKVLDDIHEDPYLWSWLRRFDRPLQPDLIDVLEGFLLLKTWRLGLPLSMAKFLSRQISGEKNESPQFATREQVVTNGEVRFVIAGHTHEPQVAHLGTDKQVEQYFIDTGTWRNRLLARSDRAAFGRVKALTYAVVYASDEDPDRVAVTKNESFDYWSGFTQRW